MTFHIIQKASFESDNPGRGNDIVMYDNKGSAVADKPARRDASRRTCCKQRWTLSVINLRPR